jgi:hypothetical protein
MTPQVGKGLEDHNGLPPNVDGLFADELGALKRLVEAEQSVLA